MCEANHALVLPFDLEREIFELAAKAFPGDALRLSTLCKYVRKWMEPLIYQTVVLRLPYKHKRLFLRNFREKPGFFASHVKRLFVTNSVTYPEAQNLFSTCTGVIDVVCWASPLLFNVKGNLIDLLPTKRLQRLSVRLDALWDAESTNERFTNNLFPNLSHLEIVDPPAFGLSFASCLDDLSGLFSLMSLTHLAFDRLWEIEHLYLIPFFEEVLKRRPRLKVLILKYHNSHSLNVIWFSEVTKDVRTVIQNPSNTARTILEYGGVGKQGGPDFWRRAESSVSQRLLEKNKRVTA